MVTDWKGSTEPEPMEVPGELRAEQEWGNIEYNVVKVSGGEEVTGPASF